MLKNSGGWKIERKWIGGASALLAILFVLSLAGVSFLTGYRVTAVRYEQAAREKAREEGFRKVRSQLRIAEEAIAREESRAASLAEWLLAVVDPDVPLVRQREGRLPSFYRRSFLPRQEAGIWSAIVVLRNSEGMGRPWMSRMATASAIDGAGAEALEEWSAELLKAPDEMLQLLKLSPGESVWRISRGRLWWARASADSSAPHIVLAIAQASPAPSFLRTWLWSNAPVTPPILDAFGGEARVEKDEALFPRQAAGNPEALSEGIREDELPGGGGNQVRGLTAVGQGGRWIVEWEFRVPRATKEFTEFAPIVDRLSTGLGILALLTALGWGVTLVYGARPRKREVQGVEPAIAAPSAKSVTEPAVEVRGEEFRWVDNGSRILGPLPISEIVRLLLAQELDFDCECWSTGRAEKLPLAHSRLFGSNDPDEEHRYWAFDGSQLHGPLNGAFLRNARLQGWLPADALLCEATTVGGWRPLDQWIADQSVGADSSPVTGSPEGPRGPASTAA